MALSPGSLASMNVSMRLALILFIAVLPTGFMTLVFSSGLTPYGEIFMTLVHNNVEVSKDFVIAGCMLLFCAYLSDMPIWKGLAARKVASVYLSVSCGLAGAGVLCFSSEWPSLSMACGIFGSVSVVSVLRTKVFHKHTTEEFSWSCSIAFLGHSVLWLIAWIIWLFKEKRFTLEKITGLPQLNNFFLWCAPLMLAVAFLLMAIALAIRADIHRSKKNEALLDESGHIHRELKMVMLGFFIAFVGLWVAACISSQDIGFHHTILRVAIFFIAGLIMFVLTSIGFRKIADAAMENKLLQESVEAMQNDWVKALVLVFAWPAFPFYILVEMLHQVVRRAGASIGILDHPGADILTAECRFHLDSALACDTKTSVLKKSIICGVLYFVMQAMVSVGITLFLAWLVDLIMAWSRASTILVLSIVGIVLFLLPPVPGMPIYLASSVLLVAQGQRVSADRFWLDLAEAMLVSWAIKLIAVAMQQKLIGVPLSTNVNIKKTIGVHTPTMKAIKSVLRRGGMDFDKVCVLCAGPDWPTSVYTGVLNLPLLEMLRGSLPVFFLILPIVVSGAFMARRGETEAENREYTSLASIAAMVAIVIQTGSFVVFCARIHSLTEKTDWKEDKELKDDQEDDVLAEVAGDEDLQKAYDFKTRWELVPAWLQCLLVLGSVSMAAMMHVLLLPIFDPFASFSVVDHISDLPGGTALGAIKRDGWFAAGCVGFGAAAWAAFETWAGYQPDSR